MGDLGTISFILTIVCIIAVCIFEFVNGFHDTANAVATVIYTNSLKPTHAVIWSGLWNFLGVITGGLGVAMGIIKLLPIGEMMDAGIGEAIAIVISVMIAAIFWNVFTWYFGIPCSSSHTLFGSLLGVGIVFQFLHGGDGPNWKKTSEIMLSLLVSPAMGFAMAIVLMFILRQLVLRTKLSKQLFSEPEKGSKPPIWIRAFLILTCTGVSYSHGSNDGQKGVGMMMIILMTFMPMHFALNTNSIDNTTFLGKVMKVGKHFSVEECTRSVQKIDTILVVSGVTSLGKEIKEVNEKLVALKSKDDGVTRFAMRKKIQKLNDNLKREMDKTESLISGENKKLLKAEIDTLSQFTDWAPIWVILMISLSLGIGTMIGWKRIVITIGERIGKSHLTYAQGMVAELMAAGTIQLSTLLKQPVSTTHILSSAIAGTMVASDGIKNLQASTIKNIAVAWVLTLPITIIVSGGLYFLFSLFI